MGKSKQIATMLTDAPAALDTLDELAAALGDDANFATTVTNSIATKLDISNPVIDMGTNKKIEFSGSIGEVGSVPGFQARNDAGSGLRSMGLRGTSLRFATGSNERLRIDDSGNVGIGTDNPSQNLHVSSTDHTRVLITGGTDKYAELQFENDAQKFAMGVQNDDKFFLYNTTGTTQVLTVDTSSNVGINTQSPGSRKLKIVGSTSAYPLALDSTDTDYALEFQRNGTSEWWLKASSTSFQIHENGSGDHVTVLSGGKVGINNASPVGHVDIVVPQDKVPFLVRSGGKSNIGYNAGHVMHCHTSLGSSGVWYDVCYVSHSPNIFILGSTVQDGSAHLGGSRYCGRMYGTYGSVTQSTFAGGTRTTAMNGGVVTGMDYRYLNSGASSGSYRLQVYVTWSGAISTMEVYTTVIGNGADTFQEDN